MALLTRSGFIAPERVASSHSRRDGATVVARVSDHDAIEAACCIIAQQIDETPIGESG